MRTRRATSERNISTLWIVVLFNMIYADILSFLKPEFLRGVLTGSVEGTRITQGILVASAVLLESSEVGVPLPGRGDVLVQVGAASVHPGDYFVMTGESYVVRLAFGLRRPRHGIPCRDLAGVVAAVGKDVTALRPRDEVFGWSTDGTLAEYACVPATTSCPCLPTCRSWTRQRCPRRP